VLYFVQVITPLAQDCLDAFEKGGEKSKQLLDNLRLALKLDLELENLYQDCLFWVGDKMGGTDPTKRIMETMRVDIPRLVDFSRSVARLVG
jgi:hypothetical protein